MADTQFISTSGIVQKFPNQDVVQKRDVSGQEVSEFTIRSFQSGKLVRVTLWPEFSSATISKIAQGACVAVDGPFNVNEVGGKTYYNLTARSIAITEPEPKSEREVVNAGSGGAAVEDDQPF